MKFSIIIPTHNRANLISHTIESVLNQTYGSFELIIIDDGSTDETEALITNYKDSRIIYVKHDRVGKLSVLRNAGIEKADGSFITFLDSDDILHPEKLSIVRAIFLKNPEINIVIHNLSTFNDDGIVKEKVYPYPNSFKKNILEDLIKNRFLPYSSYVFKKSILEDIEPINENLNDGQHDFLTRIVSVHSIYFEPLSLIKLREHSDSMSKGLSEEVYQKYTLGAFEEYLETLKNLWENGRISKQLWTDCKSQAYYSMGVRLKKQNKIIESNLCFRNCVSTQPFALNSLKSIAQYNYSKKHA